MIVLLASLGLIAAAVAIAVVVAERRWRDDTDILVARLLSEVGPRTTAVPVDALDGLPAPVRRYFDVALVGEPPAARRARLAQAGTFLLGPGQWRPFTATHHLTVSPPGFVWDARIRIAPGVDVLVRDSFVAGAGSMRASLFGTIGLAGEEGTPEIAAGALHRYLAEGVWCPTALLPEAGVRWTPLDSTSARATLTAGATSVWLDVHFGADGLIERVYTPSRARAVEGGSVPTPWQGRFRDYAERHGMRIPLQGEVEWVLPEGPQPYWRGRISAVSFE